MVQASRSGAWELRKSDGENIIKNFELRKEKKGVTSSISSDQKYNNDSYLK